ncbi:MAG: hypothetical protein J1F20_08430 [Muribaculaceae bacterium]|nr:hypothetical protein [Muribaculaceae bacterium]
MTALRGIISFLVILLMMPLGHAFVVLMEHNLEDVALKCSATVLGFVGVLLAFFGNRFRSEVKKILSGAFGAILFWGAWVEFIYINYSRFLGVQPLLIGNEVYTKPEYLMMPSALPFAVLAFIFYLYAANTNWGLVKVLRRCLHINNGFARYGESIRTFIDLILLIWWAYLILLVEYDPYLLGVRHPLTLAFSCICLVSGIILFVRSLKAQTWASALRQAIVTVCVLWTFIEVMLKLRLFTEVWIYPDKYIVEMSLTLAAFIIAIFIILVYNRKSSN